jgi:phosphate transport system substrate-binding protein
MKTSKLFLILPLIGMLSCGKAKLMIGTEASSAAVSAIKGRILFCHWHKKRREDENKF